MRFVPLILVVPPIFGATLAAQVRPAARQTAVLSGVIIDTSGVPVAAVEVSIPAIHRAASTDASGKFRLAGVPFGRARLALRRIGYRPRALEIQINQANQQIDTLSLEPFPTFLPDVSVEGRLEPPGFYLRVEVGFGRGREAIRVLPYGAAMSKYEIFTSLASGPGRRPSRLTSIRGYEGNFQDTRQVSDTLICLSHATAPVATSLDDTAGVYRILNQDGQVWVGRLQGMIPDGECLASTQLRLTEPILMASAAPNGWAVVSADSLGLVRVRLFNHFGRAEHATTLGLLFGREVDGSAVAIAPSTRGVILSLGKSPFDWVEIDTSGKAVRLGGPFDRSGMHPSLIAEGETAGWIGHQVLPIDRGYLQTFERPDHTRRVMILYDLLGRASSRPEPAVTPICIASSIERRRLLCIKYDNPWGTLSHVNEYAY
ncbi:MAG TPA: carboxypeptidase regulatory-like domain-containing protein [Gemmatimonadales bacterium]|nr:carboxypeptidase regulatory-like domain-containing protein [Gemmatimonadales bacterium]